MRLKDEVVGRLEDCVKTLREPAHAVRREWFLRGYAEALEWVIED